MEKMFYEGISDTYNFLQFDIIRSFVKNTFNRKTTLDDANEYQSDFLIEIKSVKKKKKPKPFEKKMEKEHTLQSAYALRWS